MSRYITPSYVRSRNDVLYLQTLAKRVAGYAVRNIEEDVVITSRRVDSTVLRPPMSKLTIRDIARQAAGRIVREVSK